MRNRTTWWCGVAVLTCAVLVPAGLSAQGRNRGANWTGDEGPKETETVDRTVPFPANGTLRLKNFSGDVRIVAGNGRDVVIHARRRATRERLDHVKLEVETSGSTVTVNANVPDRDWKEKNNNVVETTMEVEVPASARLDVDVFSSDVTVEGVTGDQRLKAFSGNLRVREPRSDISAETFSGDITLEVASNAKGSVSFHTFSGDLDSKLSVTSTSRRSRNIEGTLPGGAGPKMSFKTFSGDVAITSR